MTQEEKQLLLKELCARLRYRPYIDICDGKEWYTTVMEGIDLGDNNVCGTVTTNLALFAYKPEYVKLYLRPISSMKDSEIDKLFDILNIDKEGKDEDWVKINDVLGIEFFFPTGRWVENVAEVYDYLNSIHIDYRGSIEKGLALPAKEGMYNCELPDS